MKPTSLSQNRHQASATVTAMIICMVGSLGLLGAVTLLQARHAQTEAIEDKTHRRIRLMNGRQLAKEFTYRRILANATGSETTVTLADDWGQVTIPAWTENPYTTATVSGIFNQVGPSPTFEPFVSPVTATIFTALDSSSNWTATESYTLHLNAQNPALAGYLLQTRRPGNDVSSNSVSSNIIVNGKALVYQNPAQNNPFLFEANAVNAFTNSLSQTNFAVTIPSRPENFPMLPLPEGVRTAGTYVKGDRTEVNLENTVSTELKEFVEVNGQTIRADEVVALSGIDADGTGAVNITVGDFGLIHTMIQGPLDTLNIIGQSNALEAIAVENLAPVIILTNTTTLANVTFTNLNRRPLILANATGNVVNSSGVTLPVSTSGIITYTFPANADIRMFFVQQDANSQFQISGAATVRGGLSLDYDTTVSGGTLTLQEETDKSLFQTILPRSVWVESYRQL